MNEESKDVQYWADKASALARENLNLRRERDEWKNRYNEVNKIAYTELTRSHNLTLENLDLKEALALNIKQIQKLGSQLGKVSRRLHKKRSQYRELNARFQELPEAVAKINSMAFDLGVAETNLKTNRETIENLKMVVEGWKRQFDEKEKELEKLKNGVEDAKNFIQLEKSYDELYDRHQDALKQIRPLEEEVERLTKSDEQREEFIVHLESQYDQLCESHAQIRSENTIKISELEATVKTLACLLGKE